MRIALTATQRGLSEWQRGQADKLFTRYRPEAVIHGGCIGGDDELDAIAAAHGIWRVVFPSNHPTKALPKEHFLARGGRVTFAAPPMPPLKRNAFIVNHEHTILLAFPKEAAEVLRSGTWATVRLGRKLLGPDKVEIIYPEAHHA